MWQQQKKGGGGGGYERICESMVARSSCEKVVAFMSVFMTVLTLRECCCTDRSERSGENVNLKMKAVSAET